ncbi:Cupredoxin [Gongronella butleri]|nr:Cupredoxin [Gongronella butleri]
MRTPLFVLASWAVFAVAAHGATLYHEFNLTQATLRPSCGNGTAVSAITINGQVPGPTITGNVGDRLVINFRNQLHDAAASSHDKRDVLRWTGMDLSSASLHFHGLHHRGAPDQDGVPMLTQDPVMPGGEFHYDITLEQGGTFFYHAHVAMQEVTVFGALTVYESPLADPAQSNATTAHNSNNVLKPRHRPPLLVDKVAYDTDQLLMISEWFDRPDMDAYIAGPKYAGIPEADAILVNGKALPTLDALNSTTCSAEDAPIITVDKHSIVRLRIIGALVHRTAIVTIAGHRMTIIEVDGHLVTPYETDAVEVSPGQRISVLVCADQAVADYAIHVTPLVATVSVDKPTSASFEHVQSPHPHGWAILRYASVLQSTSNGDKNNTDAHGNPKAASNGESTTINASNIHVPPEVASPWPVPWPVWDQLKPVKPEPPMLAKGSKADVTIYLNTTFGREWRNGDFVQRFYVNGISHDMPSTTLLHQIWNGTRPAAIHALANLPQPITKPDTTLGTYPLTLGSVVDLVVQNTYYSNATRCSAHPWHTHGTDHWLIAYGAGTYDHQRDQHIRNVPHPIAKDTSMVYGAHTDEENGNGHADDKDVRIKGCGWAKLRFMADNPGIWAVHCHLAPHILQGMTIVLEEGIPKLDRRP